MPALDTAIIERLRRPIMTTWNSIAPDLMQGMEDIEEVMDNESAIETCIDADRLILCGNDRVADQLVSQLVDEHGYGTVLAFLGQNFRLV